MTTETNAERLESARQLIHRTILQMNSMNLLENKDVENYYWLIQQVERVAHLEKVNMRYKRALKHITVFPTYFSHEYHSKRALKIARKVLKQNEG